MDNNARAAITWKEGIEAHFKTGPEGHGRGRGDNYPSRAGQEKTNTDMFEALGESDPILV